MFRTETVPARAFPLDRTIGKFPYSDRISSSGNCKKRHVPFRTVTFFAKENRKAYLERPNPRR